MPNRISQILDVSSKIIIVLGFTLKFVIHLSLLCVYGVRYKLRFILLLYGYPIVLVPFDEEYTFCTEFLLWLYQNITGHLCIYGLYSLPLFFFKSSYHYYTVLLTVCLYCLEIRWYNSNFVLFSQICFNYFRCFEFPSEFQNQLLNFYKTKIAGIFIGIT